MANVIDTTVASLSASSFGAWGNMIHNALAACGAYLVEGPKLSATNASMTWGAQTAPFTTSTEYAYEVWRLADPGSNAVEAAAPLYIRVGFGSGTFTGTCRLRVRVGTTWATGGVVGGTVTEFDAYDGSGIRVLGLWLSCDSHGLACSHSWGGSTQNTPVFVIDRHRDLDGTPLIRGGAPTGAFLWRQGSNTFTGHLDLIEPSVVTSTSSSVPCVTNGTITTNVTTNLNDNGQTQVFPWWSTTKNAHGLSKMVCSIAQADVGAGTEQAVGWLGRPTPRTVKALGSYTPLPAACDMFGSVSAGLGLAIWWSD